MKRTIWPVILVIIAAMACMFSSCGINDEKTYLDQCKAAYSNLSTSSSAHYTQYLSIEIGETVSQSSSECWYYNDTVVKKTVKDKVVIWIVEKENALFTRSIDDSFDSGWISMGEEGNYVPSWVNLDWESLNLEFQSVEKKEDLLSIKCRRMSENENIPVSTVSFNFDDEQLVSYTTTEAVEAGNGEMTVTYTFIDTNIDEIERYVSEVITQITN